VTHPLQTFVDDYTRQIEPLLLARNEAYWIFSTQGDTIAQAEYARLNTVIRQLHADPARFDQLKALAANPTGDPLLDRQAELAWYSFQSQQMPHDLIEQIVALETGIEAQFNAFRADLNGTAVTDNELKVVLRDSNDSAERYAAWAASKQIGGRVAGQVLQAVALRNQAARAMGFGNYYSLSLTLQELDETQLFELLDQLETLTRPLFAAYKTDLDRQLADRFGVPVDQLRPWHYADPFFQEVPADPALNLDQYFADQDVVELTRQFYQTIGLPIDDILKRSDLYERPGKYQHAYCQDMDRQGDIRIVCNVKPDQYWMATMLHESGHAVYDKYHDAALPFLLREPAHTLSTEAIAMLMGRLSTNGAWLQRYAGVAPDEVAKFEQQLRAYEQASLLIFTRWALTVCNFERELYRDPQQDLNTLWWDLVEKFQLVKRPENRHAPDWAAKIHLACYPAYYQNYMLGEMTASQLLEFITTHVLNGDAAAFIDSLQVGQFLRDKFFILGSRYAWNGALQAATGEELKPEYFAKHLAR
jgi:peptidyl-dipeptidase A